MSTAKERDEDRAKVLDVIEHDYALDNGNRRTIKAEFERIPGMEAALNEMTARLREIDLHLSKPGGSVESARAIAHRPLMVWPGEEFRTLKGTTFTDSDIQRVADETMRDFFTDADYEAMAAEAMTEDQARDVLAQGLAEVAYQNIMEERRRTIWEDPDTKNSDEEEA